MKNFTHILVLVALLSVGLTACQSKTNNNSSTDSTSSMSSGNADSANGGTGSGMAADTAHQSDSTRKDSTKR
ncbi:hypothetical protein [Mucilaginibacter sp. NFX135]|uniref:hypothetical protein n=1 Tax=Mucilaginibacter sp. NFX135 TaxID=3402687 RepID=UPI003AFB78A0